MLSSDILTYIASEFLYYDDSYHLSCISKQCDIKPYQYNFKSNKNLKIKNIGKKCYFEEFVLSKKYHFIFKTYKINMLKIKRKCNLNDYFEDLEHTHINVVKFCDFYDKVLPNNLPTTIKEIIFGHVYNQPFKNNLPDQLEYLFLGKHYNLPLPEKLPSCLKEIYLSPRFIQILPLKLPKSLKKIHFEPYVGEVFTIEFSKIEYPQIEFHYFPNNTFQIMLCYFKEIEFKYNYNVSKIDQTIKEKMNKIKKMNFNNSHISEEIVFSICHFLSLDPTHLKIENKK